jgi:hypothetical protein
MTAHQNLNFGFLAAVAALSITTAAFADDPSPPAGPKHTLAYKFKPGELIRTSVLQQVRLDTTIAGSTQTAETVSGSVKVWKIQSVASSGDMTFEHAVESVNMRPAAPKSPTTAKPTPSPRASSSKSPSRSAFRCRSSPSIPRAKSPTASKNAPALKAIAPAKFSRRSRPGPSPSAKAGTNRPTWSSRSKTARKN